MVLWSENIAIIDNSGEVTLTSNFQPGDTFFIGSTNVVYTATDISGNQAKATFTVTVIGKLDLR